jgi:hypothetical protein
MRAQGGDLSLVESTGNGTIFRLTLAAPAIAATALSRASG